MKLKKLRAMAARNPIRPDEVQFILEHSKKMIVSDIAAHLKRSTSMVLHCLRDHDLQQSKELQKKLLAEFNAKRTSLTPEQDKTIQNEYLVTPVKTLADKIGRSHTIVVTRLRQLGLIIPPEIVEQRKLDSRRKKGDVPTNKGKKQEDYMTPEMIERTKATRFQSGQKPLNTIEEIGTITVRTRVGRGGQQSKWILVALGEWKQLQHYNWEQVHGPVAKGDRLRFKDGNPLNCNIENLEVISHKEHMLRNTIHNLPTDVKEIIHLKTAINRQIKKHTKP